MRRTNTHVVAIGRATNSKLSIDDQHWKDIETQCGVKIVPTLRLEFQRALNIYASYGPGSINWELRSVLHNHMRIWALNTDALRRKLSEETRRQHKPNHGLSLPKEHGKIDRIVQEYFALDRYSKQVLSTDDLSFMLEGSIHLSWSLWLKISQQRNPDPLEYWLVWVSLLISITRRDGKIAVAWTNGRKKGVHKHFIHIVDELQKVLPRDYVPRKEYNSIRKGIIAALPIAQGSPEFELKSILEAWHNGNTEYLDVPRKGHFFSPGRVISRVKRQKRKLGK